MIMWQSQSVQFVWFVTSTETVKADTLFQLLFDVEAQNIQRNRTPNPMSPFLGVANGNGGPVDATIQVQPGRLDIVLSGALQSPAIESGEPPLIDTEKSIELIRSRLNRIEELLPAVLRVALVANLMQPVESAAAAANLVSEQSGFDPGITDVTDLMIQLNRRGVIATGHTINRLMRYNVVATQSFMLPAPNPINSFQSNPIAVSVEQYATMLTLDLNTFLDGRIIEKDKLTPIFNELVKELKRIGDKPSPQTLA